MPEQGSGRAQEALFPGFRTFDIKTSSTTIHGVTGGAGPPLLLLHGYPQTHALWHGVAARLYDRFTIVACDLRGYGDSGKPPTSADHAPYSKRAMALDMAEVMTILGHERFYVCGHDRGGRVAHRLALDHVERVRRIAVLDIAPTREMYRGTTDAFARVYAHWFYLIEPAPFPERMIGAGAQADEYWRKKCGSGSAGMQPFAPAALAEYLRCFAKPETVHATCEDYRAAATIDIRHDDEDRGKKLTAPLLALWGKHGAIERCFDCLALWRERATDVRGEALPGGHYLAEELPEVIAEKLAGFMV
jgi:haloacetate dehalogenase